MSPQQLIKNQSCGSAVKGTFSCGIQVQFPVTAWGLFILPGLFFKNICYHFLSTIASTVLKSTELHGGKGNFPYKIKINKHYFKIIYDLEVLKDTRSSPGKRMNVKPEYVTGYLTLHINILTIRNDLYV